MTRTPSNRSASATRSSPTTRGPSPSSSPTASCPPTRAAATCCVASSAAPCATAGCWDAGSPSWPRPPRSSSTSWARPIPSCVERREAILGAIIREETAFARTLDAGTIQLEEALIPLTGADRVVGRRPEDVPEDAPRLDGETAFRLHDTYGFPIDLTVELAAEYGVRVDREGFEAALRRQRERSRSGTKQDLARQAELAALFGGIARRVGDSAFLGYEGTEARGRVVAIVRDGTEYQELEARGDVELRTETAAEALLVLDQTPFYAEGGGQVGDRGVLRDAEGEVVFTVEDTQRPVGGLIVHHGKLHGRVASARSCPRRWMPSAAPARCATTRARTSCTAPCATRSARPPARRGRW